MLLLTSDLCAVILKDDGTILVSCRTHQVQNKTTGHGLPWLDDGTRQDCHECNVHLKETETYHSLLFNSVMKLINGQPLANVSARCDVIFCSWVFLLASFPCNTTTGHVIAVRRPIETVPSFCPIVPAS